MGLLNYSEVLLCSGSGSGFGFSLNTSSSKGGLSWRLPLPISDCVRDSCYSILAFSYFIIASDLEWSLHSFVNSVIVGTLILVVQWLLDEWLCLGRPVGHWAVPISHSFSSPMCSSAVSEWVNALVSSMLASSLFLRFWSPGLEPQQEDKALAVLGPLSSFPVTII